MLLLILTLLNSENRWILLPDSCQLRQIGVPDFKVKKGTEVNCASVIVEV